MPIKSELSTFLSTDGHIGSMMCQLDWSASPLGHPDTWPQSLQTVIELMLSSKFPMFVAWGPELRFFYNDPYAEILRDKHPAALGKRFQDIWAEIWDDISPIIEQAMAGKASYHENLPLLMNRKGYDEQTWFTFSYSPVRNEDGKVAGMFCAVTETTEQVLAARHRAEELERMRRLFQQAPGIIAVMREPEHIFELANDAYLQLIGYRDVIGKPIREALPEITGQGFFELLDKVYRTGESFVGRAVPVLLQRTSESPLEERFVDFIYQPIKDHFGHISGIFVEGSDVTEAVRANRALRESEQRLRQLANTIPQMAWIAESDGTVHWYNDRWYEYTGTTPEQMQGWGWKGVIASEELPTLLAKWETSIATGEPYNITVPIRGADGKFRVFSTRAAPLRDAAGNIVQWFGTNTDVDDLQKMQEELESANRRKDEFLAMLAHELRNPLAPISTAAELLTLVNLNENVVRQTSNIITRQVGHMTKLVDDLLDVSRVTRGLVTLQEDTLNVNNLVADAIEQVHSLIESKHHHLSVRHSGEQFFVHGDRTRLIQVFSNLLNNAAKYTPENGHITLQINGNSEHVEILVQDDGIGISVSLLPYIFDLFTQAERSPDRSQGGLGLGLALVKSLVELQGGSVAAHSVGIGKGSSFVVRLPRVVLQEADTKQQALHNKLVYGDQMLRLVVVDDNKDAARMLCLLLEATGHQVNVAYSGQEALQVIRKTAPAICFLDIGLPDVDGYQLARQLKAQPETAHARLVAVTGYGQAEDKERALQAGFDFHMVKPVKLTDVLGLLEKVKK
jgi:PAS domain S-box-containing protein